MITKLIALFVLRNNNFILYFIFYSLFFIFYFLFFIFYFNFIKNKYIYIIYYILHIDININDINKLF